MSDAVQQAVDQWVQMEADAHAVQLLRQQSIDGITRLGKQWRVDAGLRFFIADTLEGALAKALEGNCNGR